MVAFGKKLKASQIEEWQRYYINYKLLKKKVNHYSRQIENGEGDHADFLNDFSWMLDIQIEKTVLFIIEQQGLLANRLSHLRQQQYILDQRELVPNFSEMEEAYRVVGRDLLKLLNFVELNATGLRKILKKFDKRLGYKFTNYYVKTRSNHPYSQLQQVFKHVGFGAVLGAISRNLNDLQDNHGSCFSIYDLNALPIEDSVVISVKSAIDRLTHTTNVLEFMGQHALILQEDTLSHAQDAILDQEYHFPSLLLNLANTYLYMVNTYIIVPTADNYSLSLGAAATVCGAVIGSMAVAQIFSSVYFSAWSNRSYFRPLVFSSVALLIGNVLYACAYDLNSISVLLIGRLFCGLGSARAVNRRYISDCVPLKTRLKASAGFVSASALGMASGPALACLFQTKFKVYKLTFNQDTLPGWFMALAWLLYLVCLWFAFKEPPHLQRSVAAEDSNSESSVENGLKSPLILHSTDMIQDGDKGENGKYNDNGLVSGQSYRPATSILAAYKLLTPSIKVQLLIYFMLKYALEIVLAESSVITSYYFVWSNQSVAIFLACLGLTVLPVNVIIGNYISNMFEERQVLLASEIVLCIGIIFSFHTIIPYSVPQYVCSALITFVAAEVLEGVNLSLLSRVMSSRLSRGTYNGGLLSTEAGTLARVMADGMITLAGYWGQTRLLNITLFPCLFICVISIISTFSTYNSLY